MLKVVKLTKNILDSRILSIACDKAIKKGIVRTQCTENMVSQLTKGQINIAFLNQLSQITIETKKYYCLTYVWSIVRVALVSLMLDSRGGIGSFLDILIQLKKQFNLFG